MTDLVTVRAPVRLDFAGGWTDSRDFNSEVYTANWYLSLMEARLLSPDSGALAAGTPAFRWATSWKNGQDRYRWEISSVSNFSSERPAF